MKPRVLEQISFIILKSLDKGFGYRPAKQPAPKSIFGVLGETYCGERFNDYPSYTSLSIFAAIIKSFSDSPPIECVQSSITTLL